MKKILFVVLALTIGGLFFSPQVLAACPNGLTYMGGCQSINQCLNNKKCILDQNCIVYPNGGDCGSAQLGEVKPPAAITQLNLLANNQNNSNSASGLMLFISRLINFFVIICGLWTLFNFLYAGFVLITGQSDAKAMATVKESLTMTAIGLAIIASAYLIAGVIGLIFFGDASFILNPKITGAIDLK